MGGSHARLGPSDKTWPYCPGSPRVNADYVDVAGEAAIDGTGSHELLELCLKNGVRADSYDGAVIAPNHPDQPMGWLVGLERIARVQECLDYVARRHAELKKEFPGCTITIQSESKSNPGTHIGRDDWNGTVDITITVTSPFDAIVFIEIIDYKDGRGWVDVKKNTQLLSYLLGKLDFTKGIPPARVTIVQPKTNPSVRFDDISVGDIRYSMKWLSEAAAATDDPDAPLISGDHCTWCKHGRAKNCTAKSEKSLQEVKSMTQNVEGSGSLFEIVSQTFGDITQLDSAKLEELADAKAGLLEVFDRVEADIRRRVEDPEDNTITGYAMLPGKASYEWNVSDEEIEKMLKGRRLKKSDIFPAKLITVGAMKKLDILTKDQKTKIVDKFVKKVDGKLTLKQVRTQEPTDAAVMFADVAETPEVSFL